MHSHQFYFAATFLLVLLLTLSTSQTTFSQFKAAMEEKVLRIADEMTLIYDQRCQTAILQCQVKSFIQCEGTDSQMCFDNFPKADGCLSEGANLAKTSVIAFPKSRSQLTQQENLFICASALLEDKFIQIGDEREGKFTFEYIGTNMGSTRIYPGFVDLEACNDYDPRFRPWYVTATSGSKNVILLLDVSGSMDVDYKLDIAKQALISVINTLSNNDFVGVATFSDSAQTIFSDGLFRATSENKKQLISEIYLLMANGKTNYIAAFDKGFQLLEKAKDDQFGSPCQSSQNLFLFLTDGIPTYPEEYTESNKIIEYINSRRGDANITLFSYGFGSEVDLEILLSLSCEFNGINTHIEFAGSSSELITAMRNYYNYVSEGVDVKSPIWTEPYEDAFGFGTIVTVAMPIYYVENDIRIILGVAAIDVTLDTFEEYGVTDVDEITKRLISNIPCYESSLDDCQRSAFRSTAFQCPSSEVCNITNSSINCVPKDQASIFYTPESDSEEICCGISVGGLIGIIIAVCLIFICVLVSCCVFWKKKRNQQLQRNQIYKYDSANDLKREEELRQRREKAQMPFRADSMGQDPNAYSLNNGYPPPQRNIAMNQNQRYTNNPYVRQNSEPLNNMNPSLQPSPQSLDFNNPYSS